MKDRSSINLYDINYYEKLTVYWINRALCENVTTWILLKFLSWFS